MSKPYYSQRAQCLRLSERFFSFLKSLSRLSFFLNIIGNVNGKSAVFFGCFRGRPKSKDFVTNRSISVQESFDVEKKRRCLMFRATLNVILAHVAHRS